MEKVKIAEVDTIKLQTGPDGAVWFLDGDRTPKSSCLRPDEFVASAQHIDARRVRVLGSLENATLIAQLYQHRQAAGIAGIELGSPALASCDRRTHLDVEASLYAMRQFDAVSPSLGGWHPMTAQDFPGYGMAVALRNGDVFAARELLNAHPAAARLRFIEHLDLHRLVELLALVLDPRWFVDPDKPERLGRMRSYLGLMPKYAKLQHGKYRHERYRLVLDCWKTTRTPPATLGPGYFLWRYWQQQSGGDRHADLRTSRYFVSFLRHTWIEALYAHCRPADDPTGFCPEHYFEDALEVSAYKVYTAVATA